MVKGLYFRIGNDSLRAMYSREYIGGATVITANGDNNRIDKLLVSTSPPSINNEGNQHTKPLNQKNIDAYMIM